MILSKKKLFMLVLHIQFQRLPDFFLKYLDLVCVGTCSPFCISQFKTFLLKNLFFNSELSIIFSFSQFHERFFFLIKKSLKSCSLRTRRRVSLNRFTKKYPYNFSPQNVILETHIVWCIKSRTLLYIHLPSFVSFSQYMSIMCHINLH